MKPVTQSLNAEGAENAKFCLLFFSAPSAPSAFKSLLQ